MELVLQNGHTLHVQSVKFSPNGKLIATGSWDGTVKLWDADTGMLLRTFIGHAAAVNSVDFNPGGNRIVSGSFDFTMKTWDIVSGKELRTFPGHASGVYSAVYSPNGEFIASSSDDKTVRIWDANSGEELRILQGHMAGVKSLCYSPDGKRLVSASYDKTVKLWDAESGQALYTLAGNTAVINVVDYSRDGRYIVGGADDGEVLTWNADNGQTISAFTELKDPILSLAYSPDGKYLVCGSQDRTIRVWDISNRNSEIHAFLGHTAAVTAVEFSPDGKSILSGSEDHTAKVWDATDGRLIHDFSHRTRMVSSVAFSPNGLNVVAAFNDATLKIWDLSTGSLSRSLSGHTHVVNEVAYSPDGEYLVSGSSDKTLKVWDPHSGRELRTFQGHSDAVFAVAFSPDGRTVASGSADTTVKVWDFITGDVIRTFSGGPDPVISVAYSPDGSKLVSGTSGKTITVWDLNNGGPIRNLIGHAAQIRSVAYSPDGKRIASGSVDTTIKIWDAESGSLIRTLQGGAIIYSIAFSPDGEKLISGSLDMTVKVWETVSGKLLRTLSGHTNWVSAVEYSPSGAYFMSGADDGSLRVWRASDGRSLSLVSMGRYDWIAFDDDGLFDSSRNGGQELAVVRGFEAYSLDQFAVRNNRPDLLLGRMGLITPELSAHYYAQYVKRLKKLGAASGQDLSAESPVSVDYHVPSAQITSVRQKGKTAAVAFTISDSKYELVQYNIFVNDVPVFGAIGKPVSGKSRTLEENIELTAGENKIEISCMNEKNTEAFRKPVFVKYEGRTSGDLYFLAFGISKYRDAELNLRYADKDAADLAAIFSSMEADFSAVHTRVYLNEEVTVANIKAAKSFLANSKVDDTVVLFIAGHGVYDRDDTAAYYFLTYEADLNKLSSTSADFELIEDLLQGIAPRCKLFLMDTCESGDADAEDESGYYSLADSRGILPRTIRGLTVAATGEPKAQRPYLLQNERYIYNDMVRRSGAIVFSSSRGSEFSYESDQYQNGHFTEELVKALSGKADKDSDGFISTDELKAYVMESVPPLSAGLQHPTVDRDNIYTKFRFPAAKPGSTPNAKSKDYASPTIGLLKFVPAGTFQRNAKSIEVSSVVAFRIGQYEITRAQFLSVMGTDPSDANNSSGLNDPVQNVTWYQAIAFCNVLSIKEGLKPVYHIDGQDFSKISFADIPNKSDYTWNTATADLSANGYRLPTEAEWRWAAMGADTANPGQTNAIGFNKAFAGSDGKNALGDYAWYEENSEKRTHPVGEKLPNELGLFDMSGNAYEWCWDWFDVSYTRLALGGSRGSSKEACSIKTPYYCPPGSSYFAGFGLGFRVVRN